MIEDKGMSACEFRDDDAGYLAWVGAHPDGYVINIARSHNPAEARVHRAGCRWISGRSPRGRVWTGLYVKVCAERLTELEQWAMDRVGELIPPCGTCHLARPITTTRIERATAAPVSEGRCEIHGPVAGSAVVEAWADDYIRFERRPAWQNHLRTEIQTRCGQLEPSAGQLLHATFFGAKLGNADVENLALYNVSTFKAGLCRCAGKLDGDFGAARGVIVGGDAAVVALGEGVDDGQSESGAAGGPSGVGAAESV